MRSPTGQSPTGRSRFQGLVTLSKARATMPVGYGPARRILWGNWNEPDVVSRQPGADGHRR
jgi:hypothetical protein